MNTKQLSNPFSTGGGGFHFEAHIQASFVTLMLTGGYAPCLPSWPIKEIILQGKIEGFDTDDLIVIIESRETQEQRKILGQVKHTICFTKGNQSLSDFINGAWNDFNKPAVFSKGKDVLGLFTGPISETDSTNIKWLLNQAKTTLNASEFFRNVEQSNFSPNKCSEKLEVLKYHLYKANNDVELTNEELFSFLKHFYLLSYDLGNEFGVVLSLLQSHISQFYSENPQLIWSRIVEFVESKNQAAGKITLDNIPTDLIEVFKHPTLLHMPEGLSIDKMESVLTDWNKHKNAKEFALVSLIGSWDDKSKPDINLITEILFANSDSWIEKIREILLVEESPCSLNNGHWSIENRKNILESLNPWIFDNDLDNYQNLVIRVLSEINPSLNLPKTERYLAPLSGKILKCSDNIRKGLAEGLAILGNSPELFSNTSRGKTSFTVINTIKNIFKNNDWRLWASLNNVLPFLAEAAPDEFLNQIEEALHSTPCIFDDIFAQEGSGIFGGNYMTGLLWSLESLAWDEKYLVRVSVIFGEFAAHDPGGNYSNRPNNSLKTIFLPWFPQTLASIDKRVIAIKTLCKEFPDIGWELLLKLLPNQHQSTSGAYKPKYRLVIPKEFDNGVSNMDYYNQVSSYGDIAVRLAKNDPKKLVEVIDLLENLPKSSFNIFIEDLTSADLQSFSENDRNNIWNGLRKCIKRLRRFPEKKNSIINESIVDLEGIANSLKPTSFFDLYKFLFSDQDFELFEETDNWKEQRELLLQKRINAISNIFTSEGVEQVIKFSEFVKMPYQVGYSFGCIGSSEIDSYFFPKFLRIEKRESFELLSGYIWSRYVTIGWAWVDTIEMKFWSVGEISKFYTFLPFSHECWKRVDKQLGKHKFEYWSKVNVNPYQESGDLDFAVKRLLAVKRPNAAIDCLHKLHMEGKPITVKYCLQALNSLLVKKDSIDGINPNQIVGVIQALQKSEEVSEKELIRIEWAFLPLLDHDRGASPITLESKLVTDPYFFCELMQLMYRSKKIQLEETKNIELKKSNAENAWYLLHSCKTIPGKQKDGSFDEKKFLTWLKTVIEICTETGHLEVALTTIGELLVNSPEDSDGLFINRIVADALNDKGAEDMRTGYMSGTINSRGVHWVDPTGNPELELAKQFTEKAEKIEKEGFFRLAKTFRDLAESNEREAKRIIDEHKLECDDD